MKDRRLSKDTEIRAVQQAVIPHLREMAGRLVPNFSSFWFYTRCCADDSSPRSYIGLDAICRKPCCLGALPETRHEVSVSISLLTKPNEPLSFYAALSWSEACNPVPEDDLPGYGPSDWAIAKPEVVIETMRPYLEVFPAWVAWLDAIYAARSLDGGF
jgi:hypothetical protein